MKILVCCSAGMSSSILVTQLRGVVQSRELTSVLIGSCSIPQLKKYVSETDILLVMPQLSFYVQEIEEMTKDKEIYVYYISQSDFGTLNVDKILDEAMGHISTEVEEIQSMGSFYHKYVFPLASFVGGQNWLKAIGDSFLNIFSVTMVGSFFTLLLNLPIPGYADWLLNTSLYPLFELPSRMTTGLMALYLSFFLAYNYCESKDVNGKVPGIAAMVSFIMVSGFVNNQFTMEYFGVKGLFTAMFAAYVSSVSYLFMNRIQPRLKIKFINDEILYSLTGIGPIAFVILVFLGITLMMRMTVYDNLSVLIYESLQTRISSLLSGNIASWVGFQGITNGLWFFGIHGGNVVGTITKPIYTIFSLENVEAFQLGLLLPNIINNEFSKSFIFGGAGSTLGLAILMCFKAKSTQMKTIGKLSLPTTIFFINEPLMFGIPIVMNPTALIPLLFITPTCGIITYLATTIGIIPPTIGFPLPWTTPPIINGFVQGGWRLALWEVLMLTLSVVLWYPFFKKMDQKALLKEQ